MVYNDRFLAIVDNAFGGLGNYPINKDPHYTTLMTTKTYKKLGELIYSLLILLFSPKIPINLFYSSTVNDFMQKLDIASYTNLD